MSQPAGAVFSLGAPAAVCSSRQARQGTAALGTPRAVASVAGLPPLQPHNPDTMPSAQRCLPTPPQKKPQTTELGGGPAPRGALRAPTGVTRDAAARCSSSPQGMGMQMNSRLFKAGQGLCIVTFGEGFIYSEGWCIC